MSASASKGRRRSFNRRDFGLGQRKIAVPGAEGNGGVLLGSPTAGNVAEPSKKKKAKRRSVGERVMDMFHLKKRGEGEQKATLPVVPPSPQQALRNNLQSLPTSSGSSPRASPRLTPTPSPLRSRALRQQVFTERHDSLEAVMHEYGYKKDGTPMLGRKKMQPEDKMVRLKIKSSGKDKDDPITLIKDDEGTGIHLSTGLPPFTVTYVEPGSKGMLAGIRVGDVIVEVNGRDCNLMDDSLDLTDVMELKSIITHIPGSRPGSRPGSALSGRRYINGGHIRITSIDSDTDSSDEGDDEEDQHWNGNGQRRKKKITKGVWNRIKAEGLHDSDSESSGSFVNLVMESSSDEDDFIDKWNKQALNKEKEIEMDDRQWRQMRQKQNLIFNRDAPSYMISSPQNASLSNQHQLLPPTNPLTDEPLASKKKRHFRWPFTRPVTSVKPPSHKQVKKTRNAANSPRTKSPLESVLVADMSGAKILKSTDDNASNTGDSDNSSLYERPHILEKATVEGRTKKSSHSKDSVTRKPSRSQSLIEKGHKLPIRTKRLSKEAPPDIGVERNSPLLGVNDGRNKRDLARARKVRRPTTRGKSGGEREGDHGGRVEGGGATLSIGQSGDEVVLQEQSANKNSTSHHIISKAVSDPGNTSHNNQESTETTQKSMKRRSTASLVEEAVRRRSLAQKEEEEEEEEKEVSTSRRRKHAVAPYETSVMQKVTAQVVANAAAMKAKEIQQKQLKKEHKVKEAKEEQVPLAHRKMRQDKLAQMSGFHPLHKSRSFQDEREKGTSGKMHEATWISLAKAKHEKMTEEFNQKSGARSKNKGEPHLYDRKARLSMNRSVSLNDEMDAVGDEGNRQDSPAFVTDNR